MRTLLVVFFVCLACGAMATLASAVGEHITTLPPGIEPGDPVFSPLVQCDVTVRYDDGGDDSPGSGPTLGWYSSTNFQYLGVRSFPTGTGSHLVQSASWFSDFWVTTGLVAVTVYELGNPSNTATETVTATAPGPGTWGVDFANPICIPEGGEYVVMICPLPPGQGGGWGVVGDDSSSAYAGRSYWSSAACQNDNSAGSNYMIWSCVTPCGATPAQTASWGNIKAIYR